MGIAAFIPAKMTSMRLPGKNMKMLCGYPLVYYSIKVASLVKEIEHIIVSSEDKEVLRTAIEFGAIPLSRPRSLSGGKVTNITVLKHFYKKFSEKAEIVVLLQPNHPLRHPEDIANAIDLFKQVDADSLFSVAKTDQLLGRIENGFFVPEFPLPRNKASEPVRYKNTGSFYIFTPDRSFLTESPFGEKIVPYVLGRPEFEVDIDTASDMRLATCLLESNAERFNHFDIKL